MGPFLAKKADRKETVPIDDTDPNRRIEVLESELAEVMGDRDKWIIEAKKDHDFWLKRIAELEAELADGYACHVAAHQLLEERAEKAEAEVERVTEELDLALNVINPGREQRIRTFGGGLAPAAREKERDDG